MLALLLLGLLVALGPLWRRSSEPARARRRPRPGGRLRAGVRRALDGHAAEVAGLLCVALGLVAGLGVYADSAGPLGRVLADFVGTAVGWGRVLVPPALLAAGVLLVKGLPQPDPDSDVEPSRANVWLGGLLIALAGAGLAHLAGGRPPLDAPVDDLSEAGGLLGLAVAGPLAYALAPIGATLILASVLVAGLVLITQVSLRVAAARASTGLQPTRAVVRDALIRLVSLGSDRDGAEGAGALLYDQDQDRVDDNEAEASSPPRSRRPKVEVAADTQADSTQLEIELGPAAKGSAWKLPPSSLLHRTGAHEVDRSAVDAAGRTLERALAQHGVETRLVGMVVGPSVTRFELELAPGVKVNRVTSLHKDIAYAMASPDVRILAPIPGRQAIGVEVPNIDRRIVALGDVLASPEAKRAHHPLEVAMGRDINGKPMMLNLAQMPHILIAGATGAGKSSCLNSMLTSVLMRSTPDQVRMILVDPKRVEMGQYDRLPHLLTQVVTNPKKAANALGWAVREMERRYELLAEVGFRDVTGYNAAWDRGELVAEPGSGREPYPRLPFVLIMIDELADLMLVAARTSRSRSRGSPPWRGQWASTS